MREKLSPRPMPTISSMNQGSSGTSRQNECITWDEQCIFEYIDADRNSLSIIIGMVVVLESLAVAPRLQ